MRPVCIEDQHQSQAAMPGTSPASAEWWLNLSICGQWRRFPVPSGRATTAFVGGPNAVTLSGSAVCFVRFTLSSAGDIRRRVRMWCLSHSSGSRFIGLMGNWRAEQLLNVAGEAASTSASDPALYRKGRWPLGDTQIPQSYRSAATATQRLPTCTNRIVAARPPKMFVYQRQPIATNT